MSIPKNNLDDPTLKLIGWREWVSLPALGVEKIKAKVDTGARSSAIHAFDIERFKQNNKDCVRFALHPLQRDDATVVYCEAELLDRRPVRSSSGEAEKRYVIQTALKLCGEEWPIELTLTNRDSMGFRMLVGREAIRGRFAVDPSRSFYGGRPKKPKKKAL